MQLPSLLSTWMFGKHRKVTLTWKTSSWWHMNLKRHCLCCVDSQHLDHPGTGFPFNKQPCKDRHAQELQTNVFQIQFPIKSKIRQNHQDPSSKKILNFEPWIYFSKHFKWHRQGSFWIWELTLGLLLFLIIKKWPPVSLAISLSLLSPLGVPPLLPNSQMPSARVEWTDWIVGALLHPFNQVG